MSRIRLYLDEDSMSRGLVRALRAPGEDVITAVEADFLDRCWIIYPLNTCISKRLIDDLIEEQKHNPRLRIDTESEHENP